MDHGSVARAVQGMLEEYSMARVFTAPVSALDCAEPVVCLQGGFEREALLPDGSERGTVTVRVLAVREDWQEAEVVAYECADVLRGEPWEPWADCGRYRLVGVDPAEPSYAGPDGSGRHVWGLDVDCVAVRS